MAQPQTAFFSLFKIPPPYYIDLAALTKIDIFLISEQRAMKFSAASHGVSIKNKFNPNAASCGELNPADFTISTPHLL